MISTKKLPPVQTETPLTLEEMPKYYCNHMNNGLSPLIRIIAIGRDIPERDIDDLKQEAFIKIYEAAGRNPRENIKSPTNYIWRVVINVCLEFHRTVYPRARTDIDWTGGRYGAIADERKKSPLQILLEREESNRIRDAVSKLTPKNREAITLRYYENLSYRDMAELLGEPQNTVLSRVRRGLKSIRHYSPLNREYAQPKR